jgi:hypothetical protein
MRTTLAALALMLALGAGTAAAQRRGARVVITLPEISVGCRIPVPPGFAPRATPAVAPARGRTTPRSAARNRS